MSELDNFNSSKVFMLRDEIIAEAFLEYYNNKPFINVYVDVSVDMYFRLQKDYDTIMIFENLTRVLVESLTKHGFACNEAGALQFRLHLN
jgi:hypothetical protein